MKMSIVLLVAVTFILTIVSEAESKFAPNCVKDCEKCKKHCNQLKGRGHRCEITKPRKANNYCTCHGIGTIPVCKGGVQAQAITNWVSLFMPMAVTILSAVGWKLNVS